MGAHSKRDGAESPTLPMSLGALRKRGRHADLPIFNGDPLDTLVESDHREARGWAMALGVVIATLSIVVALNRCSLAGTTPSAPRQIMTSGDRTVEEVPDEPSATVTRYVPTPSPYERRIPGPRVTITVTRRVTVTRIVPGPTVTVTATPPSGTEPSPSP